MKKSNLLSAILLASAWFAGSSAMAHDGEHTYVNGICTIEECDAPNQAPALVDGWYEICNAGNVEFISESIAAGATDAEGNPYATAKYKMMNDIDFTGVNHPGIGPNDNKKFNGVWDGQGHTIKNLTMEGTNVGFFSWVRGGTTIQNMIIDKTCSFTATERCGALIGIIQAKAGGPVAIYNIVNFATVTSGSKVAGGIVAAGATNNDHPVVNMANCVNAGTITCSSGSDRAAGLLGWNKSASISTLKACYNIGECSPLDGANNLFRGSNRSLPNTFDLTNTTAQGKTGTQGLKTDWKTADPLHSGELCYVLNNGDMSDAGIKYKQDLSDPNSIPMPVAEGPLVYQIAEYNCDGSIKEGSSLTYTNVQTDPDIPAHTFNANGFCTACGSINPEYVTLSADGFYHLSTVAQVEWFSAMVNKGNITINGMLDNDIDFMNVENAHTPIGDTSAQKYNGTFDGQGHRIMNMIINRPEDNNIGFFGFLRGNEYNTTVRNLIIDKSCTIHGRNRIGGIAGSFQNGGATITIENCINEATIIAEHQDAAAIIGGRESGNPIFIIRNCLNTGSVTAKNEAPYAGALCCYLDANENSVIENFVNLGTINGHNGGNMGRHNIPNVTNLIDLSATEDKTQGTDSGLTSEDIASGKLASVVAWGQLIGTDAAPSPLSTDKVYAGWATMVAAEGCALNNEAKAYIGKVNGQYLTLTEIADIPAGTAVVMNGTYYNAVAAAATSDVSTNELKGTTETTEANGNMYVLANVNDVVGFYKATGTIPTGKAYIESAAGVKAFFFGDDATGIELTPDNGQQTTEIFNLAGQRVSKMQKGVNIVNGKKVMF